VISAISLPISPLRPNLFLIGSMKSGTTYLSQLLAAHPAVFVCSPKEPCHFVDPKVLRRAWPWMWDQGYWRSQERYLGLFSGSNSAAVIAEASTVYAKLPMFSGVCERILDFNPRARFIYIMRDPVERAISHYWHRVRWWGERRSLLSALRQDPQYEDVSHYALQLNEYLRHVGRERVHTLTMEELLADTPGQMRRVYTWLDVDPSFHPPPLGPSNVRPPIIEQVGGLGLLHRLRKLHWHSPIMRYVPQSARRLAATLAVRTVRPAEVSDDEAREYLRSRQLGQTEALSQLLQRRFCEWTTLYGRAPLGVTAAEHSVQARCAR
jgi:hypothetical protein